MVPAFEWHSIQAAKMYVNFDAMTTVQTMFADNWNRSRSMHSVYGTSSSNDLLRQCRENDIRFYPMFQTFDQNDSRVLVATKENKMKMILDFSMYGRYVFN